MCATMNELYVEIDQFIIENSDAAEGMSLAQIKSVKEWLIDLTECEKVELMNIILSDLFEGNMLWSTVDVKVLKQILIGERKIVIS